MSRRRTLLPALSDPETRAHTIRVGDLAAAIARELNLSQKRAERLRRAAQLHDIGKVAIPKRILNKQGPLTPTEHAIVRAHALIGARLLRRFRSPLLRLAEEVARTHHERWDGTGYPAGLKGEAIPFAGRIVAVADVFDAMVSRRSYKDATPRLAALAAIRAEAGTLFDPSVVAALERITVAR